MLEAPALSWRRIIIFLSYGDGRGYTDVDLNAKKEFAFLNEKDTVEYPFVDVGLIFIVVTNLHFYE